MADLWSLRGMVQGLVAVTTLVSCATPTLTILTIYQRWGVQIDAIVSRSGGPDDVSLLLGGAPSRCDAVEAPPPILGLRIRAGTNQVQSILPGSPAQAAGLAPGDRVLSVGPTLTPTTEAVLSAISSLAVHAQELAIATERGKFLVTPRIPDAEQCYWEISGGRIAQSAGAATVGPYAGSASGSSSGYDRFFRATCRVYDSHVVVCQWNYQQ